jgi:hypothetical protein
MSRMAPLYPQVRVALRSRNRYALVSAIRQALRLAGTSPNDIETFSREALTTQDRGRFEELCSRWVVMDRTHQQLAE